MKFRRVKAVALKEIKRIIREPASLFMIILFPLVFVIFYGIAFGEVGESSNPIYTVGVLVTGDMGEYTLKFLESLSSSSILNIQIYQDNSTAQEDLSQGKIQAIIVISGNFDQSLTSYHLYPDNPSKWVNVTLLLYIDKGSLIATQIIPPIVERIAASMINMNSEPLTPVHIKLASFIEVKKLSSFELSAPGMFTFASIYIIMIVSQSFTQERESGLLKRVLITPITSAELIVGNVIAYMAVAFMQSAVLFVAIYVIGFRPSINIAHYVVAFVFILIFSISNIGLGLITSAISRTTSIATGISFIFIMPQLFLGTFIAYSLSPTARLASKFIPSYYVTDALTTIFLRGASPISRAILYNLLVVTIFSMAILFIGIYLYERQRRI
ncbi:MAG: ABC transporter permease [Ignisphaera sp.]